MHFRISSNHRVHMFKLINSLLDTMLENFFEGAMIEPEAETDPAKRYAWLDGVLAAR